MPCSMNTADSIFQILTYMFSSENPMDYTYALSLCHEAKRSSGNLNAYLSSVSSVQGSVFAENLEELTVIGLVC